MREVIKTAATVEEAKELALEELGISEDDGAVVEILEWPQRRLFRKIPAKVRAYAEENEDTVKAAPKTKAPAVKKEAPKAEIPAVKKEAPKAEAAASEKKPAEKKEAPKAQEPAPEKKEPAAEETIPEEPFDLESCPKAQEAVAYLREICAKLGAENLDITAVKQGETVILKIEGENAGTLIGHRGEVMEALSYLTSLVANRAGGDYLKLSLDINHYRAKREANLTALAKRIAAKVQRTGRSQTLEPMNPYERRIIHSAVSTVEGVKSESTGEGAGRRVVISSTDPNARPPRENRGGRNSRGGRSGSRSRAPRRDSERAPRNTTPAREFADRPRDTAAGPVVPKRTETINDGADLPLYGKIEL